MCFFLSNVLFKGLDYNITHYLDTQIDSYIHVLIYAVFMNSIILQVHKLACIIFKAFIHQKDTILLPYESQLKPKTVWRPSEVYNGNPFTKKAVSSLWIVTPTRCLLYKLCSMLTLKYRIYKTEYTNCTKYDRTLHVGIVPHVTQPNSCRMPLRLRSTVKSPI